MKLRSRIVFAELGQQRVLKKHFGCEWNRHVFAIKGKRLVSPGVRRQELADSCSDWTEEPSVGLDLGCAAQTGWARNPDWTLCKHLGSQPLTPSIHFVHL